MTLGERIRAVRERRKLTQQQLAQLVEVRSTTISEIERSVYKEIGSNLLRKLARALDTSADYLLGTWEEQDSELQPATTALVGA